MIGLWLSALGCAPDYWAYERDPDESSTWTAGIVSEGGVDWVDCQQGFAGAYSNLEVGHPDVEPGPDEPVSVDPFALDWWDEAYAAFERFEPSLDFGEGWWPVDEGLTADPRYFAARWTAGLRVWRDGPVSFVVGAADDVWVLLDGEVVLARPGIPVRFVDEVVELDLSEGEHVLEVRFAHRGGQDSGLRFRVASAPDVAEVCY